MESPVGGLNLVFSNGGLCALDWVDCWGRTERILSARFDDFAIEDGAPGGAIAAALNRYLAGELEALDDIDVDAGGTAFQQDVWAALRAIPAGETSTYAAIAGAIGRPNAAQAVGAANAINPVSLVIPCHRVVGASGKLVGYAGGVHRKRWLLAHERARR